MIKTLLSAAVMLAIASTAIAAAAPAQLRQAPKESLRASARNIPESEWKFQVTEADIVRETPAGTKSLYSKACDYYANSMFGILQGSTAGMPCTVVEGTDGTFWIYAPFARLDTGSWLKAQISGDRMTINLPQAIYSDSDGENSYVYVAQLCHFEADDAEDPEAGGLYYAEEGKTTIEFTRDGDSWVMKTEEKNDHPMIMGLVAADDGSWCAYSDWNMKFTPFTDTPAILPDGLTAEQWTMLLSSEGNYVSSRDVKVAFDGNEVWLSGFSTVFPEAWVKGSIADGKAVFASEQYLGADENIGAFGYFYGADQEEKYNEEWDFTYTETTLADNLTFDYDAAKRSFTSTQALGINKGRGEMSLDECIEKPEIFPTAEVTDFIPADPVLGLFSLPESWAGNITFIFPTLNAAGQPLDPEKLFYTLYVDGEPFEFYSDEFAGIEDGTTEVPFSFTNMDTLGRYGTGNTTHFIYYTFTGFEKLDLRTFYIDGDKRFESKMLNIYDAASIGAVEATPASVEWYDFSGRRVMNPEAGIYIRKAVYADGTVKTTKEAVRR